MLGALPLDIRIREEADGGTPTVVAEPHSSISAIYRDIARKAAGRLSRQARNKKIEFPSIVIQNS
jgi:ATP-binding protein involved in chromosome partitioning